MTASPTAAERAALPVARAALESRDSSHGISDAIVFALGAAGLLADAEVAQAVAGLRADELAPGSYPRMRAALGALQAAQRQHGEGLVPQVWALEAAGLLQSPETAAEMVELRKRVAEIDARQLGDLSSLVSRRCVHPTHPLWLTVRTDRSGCPWCRLAESERLQQPVGRTAYLADYDGAEDGPKIFASLDAAKSWVEEWSTGDTWDWFELDGVHEQWTCDKDSDRPTNRGNGTVTPLEMPAELATARAEGGAL